MAYITYLRILLSYSYFEIIYILRHKQVSEKDMFFFQNDLSEKCFLIYRCKLCYKKKRLPRWWKASQSNYKETCF